MPLNDLTSEERQVIEECLRAVVSGPFIPMWEFHTLLGLTHQEVSDIAYSRAGLDDSLPNTRRAIGVTLNNLMGYPHKKYHLWPMFISVPAIEVRRIEDKWRESFVDRPPRWRRPKAKDAMIDLYSDTLTQPTETMRYVMARAPVGDEQRREDPSTNQLQERVAKLLGKE